MTMNTKPIRCGSRPEFPWGNGYDWYNANHAVWPDDDNMFVSEFMTWFGKVEIDNPGELVACGKYNIGAERHMAESYHKCVSTDWNTAVYT